MVRPTSSYVIVEYHPTNSNNQFPAVRIMEVRETGVGKERIGIEVEIGTIGEIREIAGGAMRQEEVAKWDRKEDVDNLVIEGIT